MFGPEGGVLDGPAGTPAEGVQLVIPAGALREPVTLGLSVVDADVDEPPGVDWVGRGVWFWPTWVRFDIPALAIVPYDEDSAAAAAGARPGQPVEVALYATDGFSWERLAPVGKQGRSPVVQARTQRLGLVFPGVAAAPNR